MFVSRLAPALLLAILAGCSLSPVALLERPLLAHCLPDGIRMNDFVEVGPLGMRVTVAEKLARLGAIPGWDGKLYDLSGKRIEFWHHRGGGANIGDDIRQEDWRHLEELKKTCTVIEILGDPRLPPPQ
jgi:hypothetical protein